MNGWECPKCGNVYSPKVQECSACNKKNVVWIPNYPPQHPGWIYRPDQLSTPWFSNNTPAWTFRNHGAMTHPIRYTSEGPCV